ncbi:hypothetical protein [Rhizobium aethiopicum]|uniref:Uncharacterized protein n=1 Tax=Rhizobium aethiopicum TaxID=1138170 RepID=A0A7W6MHK3_9HYPH|nr:hypothetical protein [Rhizobium aethiopicum]MBB4192831.1 hypothetical protein [Rhizobium aethiopicum]
MTTMIERVARAIAKENNTDAAFDLPWEFFIGQARAVLEEIREPSAAQLAAAEEIVVGYDDFACGDGNVYLAYPEYYDKAKHVWQSLIDAALKEETP